jgi:hypothetical protein
MLRDGALVKLHVKKRQQESSDNAGLALSVGNTPLRP